MSKVADAAEAAMRGLAPGAEIFDLKVNYISDFEPGEELTTAAEVVHAGRRTVVTACRIEAGARLVATASATFVVAPNEEQSKVG
ncbi:MAG TPA: acyl-CoA thioesterase domain-containing protein [Candidatus Dormibacteraeota bacterium]|nr:acyl-CoA thioesterase domain-containing protein [Candidatus Dormibacteraeota bacterium]